MRDPRSTRRVDAHHYVWRIARGDYGWLTPDMPIYRDYALTDLCPLLGEVTATVRVQAAPTTADTDFLLRVAAASRGLVRGVVGWAALTAPDATQRIAALADRPRLRGLRPMLQDIADADWIMRPALRPALRAMALAGLRFDALIQPRHLPLLPRLAGQHPDLAIAIDHAAKPAIARGEWQPWANDIARAARETQAFCKLSGLITEAASDWTIDDLRRYVDHLLACFGPARLMWGSDWPVVELAGGYRRWRNVTEILLAGLDGPAQDAILGATATTFYRLDEAP